MAPRVVLIGPPGSGKSTTGKRLAKLLGVEARDTDADVEAIAGKPISDIFLDDGEPAFRDLEATAVRAALAEHEGVLALGGGAILREETAALIAEYAAAGGAVVYLEVSLASAAPRVGLNRARPLLVGNPRAQWQQLMDERRDTYERLATLTISTDGRRPAQVADEVLAGLTP